LANGIEETEFPLFLQCSAPGKEEANADLGGGAEGGVVAAIAEEATKEALFNLILKWEIQ